MRPAPFDYFAPRTVEEALDLLARHGEDAKLLAGGQSLVPMMNMRLVRPAVIVDLNRVAALGALREEVGGLRLGALVRQHALERDGRIAATAPLLAEAAPLIGHLQTRARGTIGGSLAHADPAAELPACMIALDAVGVCRHARLVIFGAGDGPHLARAATALLGERPSAARLGEIGRAAAGEIDARADLHATPEYRRRVAAGLAARVLGHAAARAEAA